MRAAWSLGWRATISFVRHAIGGLALLGFAAAGCVDLPEEPDRPYLECSNAEGLWGGVERNGETLCLATATVEVTGINTLFVVVPFARLDDDVAPGSLTLNFELPVGGVPSAERLEGFTMGRYSTSDGQGEVLSASITVAEDEQGALGTFAVDAVDANGDADVFTNGVYYAGPIRR